MGAFVIILAAKEPLRPKEGKDFALFERFSAQVGVATGPGRNHRLLGILNAVSCILIFEFWLLAAGQLSETATPHKL